MLLVPRGCGEAAGYDGTPIRILGSRLYECHCKISKAYPEAAGFKTDLQVVDWARLTQRRADPAQWDIFITHSNLPGDPSTITDTCPGWYVSDRKAQAVEARPAAASDADKSREGIQAAIQDDAPLIKLGNFNTVSGVSQAEQGYAPTYWPHFRKVSPRRHRR